MSQTFEVSNSSKTPIPYKFPFPIKSMPTPEEIIQCLDSSSKRSLYKKNSQSKSPRNSSLDKEIKSQRNTSIDKEISIETKNSINFSNYQETTESLNNCKKLFEKPVDKNNCSKNLIQKNVENSFKKLKEKNEENFSQKSLFESKKISGIDFKKNSENPLKKTSENPLKKMVSFDDNENMVTSHRIHRKLTPFAANKIRKIQDDPEEKALKRRLFTEVESSDEIKTIDEKILEGLKESCRKNIEQMDKENLKVKSKKKMLIGGSKTKISIKK